METKVEEKKVAAIPTSITIGEITYVIKDTPELQSLIASVSKVEKDKLYSQFESLKNQVNQLGNIQVKEASNAPLDAETLKKDIVETVTEKFSQMLAPILSATKDSKQNELNQYRESLIKANLDKCIPELVEGNTKEELNASLAKSISLRAKYVHPLNNVSTQDPLLKQEAERLENETKEVKEEKPIIPTVPKRESPDGFEAPEDVKTMSMEEYAQRRDSIQKQLQTMYP